MDRSRDFTYSMVPTVWEMRDDLMCFFAAIEK